MKPNFDSERISLAECRKILNGKGKNYTDAEIEKIRNWIYKFVGITLQFLEGKSRSDIHQLQELLTQKVKNRSERKD